jgi:EAL domain-containing protein (putative c-di-GMP-specific phosphodiesterase class I)
MEEIQQLLGLAREARLRTCAQGVERPAQWQVLKESGCELAGGPFIAPAMHLEQAMQWALRKARQRLKDGGSGGSAA